MAMVPFRAEGGKAAWKDCIDKLQVGSYFFVFYVDDNVWHERLAVWQVSERVWIIYTPDGDRYPERYSLNSLLTYVA